MKISTKKRTAKEQSSKEYESEEHYRILFENIPIGVGVADMAGNLIFFNEAMLKPGNYSREDIYTLKNVAALYYDTQQRDQVLGLFRKQGSVHKHPVQFKRKDGTPYDTLLTLIPILINGKPCIQALAEDVTDRKRAEHALQLAEEKYRTMVEQSPLIMYLDKIDEYYSSFYISPQVHNLLGYLPEEILEDPHLWNRLILKEDHEQAMAFIQRTIEHGRAVSEYQMRKRDGTIVWIRDTGVLLRDENGMPQFLQGFIEDITERKIHELELEAEAMLAQALGETLELQPLLERLLEAARHAIPSADKGSILLMEPNGKLRICAMSGYTDSRLLGFVFANNKGYSARAAHEQKPLIFSQVRTDDELRYDGDIDDARAVLSAIAVPLIIQDRVIGVIALDSIQENTFNEANLRLLVKFATSAALILERTSLFEETQLRLKELQALYESGLTLSNLFEPHAIGKAIVKILKQHMNWNHAVIRIRKRGSDELEVIGYGALNLQEADEQAEVERMNRLISKVGEGMTGWVIQHGVSVYSKNLPEDSRYIETNPGILSGIYVPIISSERTMGAIGVESESSTAFDEHAKRFLSTLAAQAASALENARLFNDMQKRLAELSVLHQSSQSLLVAGFDPDMTYTNVHEAVKHVMPCDAFVIVLDDEAGGDYHAVYRYDKGVRYSNTRVARGQGLSGQVIAEGNTLLVADYHNQQNIQAVHFGYKEHVRSILAVPLWRGGKTFGMISCQAYEQNMYNESHRVVLETIAAQFASSIENARLFQATIQQLNRLTVLRDMDRVIASSFDLQIVFNLLLSHVIEQLQVDATSVLLFNPDNHMLEYAAGRGFHSKNLSGLQLKLGESWAGKAAMERREIFIPDFDAGNQQLPESLKEDNFKAYYAYPLVTKGELKGVLQIFNRTPLSVTQDWINFFETLAGQAAIAIDNVRLFENLERSNFELTLAYDKTIEGWSKALDLRDRETEGHTRRVTDLTLKLAQHLGLNRTEIINLRRGALLHDIGKIGIPDHILLKPGKLTDEEWMIMRQHPQYAYDMLAAVEYLRPALEIPYSHHEKWDGSGYPRGLKGEEIPLAARIFAVADVWDALTSHRPYRLGWSKEQALDYIRSQSKIHFDPKVVEAFFKVIESS